MNTPDESVMLAVKGNDVGQLATLFERHYGRLFDYFFRMTGSHTASEDLVQEVFVRILKYRNTFHTGSHFMGWMFRIARNARLRYIQSKQRAVDENADLDLNTVAMASAENERTLQLRQAFLRLPDDKRELLILARYQGLSSEEIAALLDIDVGAVKVRIHRAMNELRALILNSPDEKSKCTVKRQKTILRTT